MLITQGCSFKVHFIFWFMNRFNLALSLKGTLQVSNSILPFCLYLVQIPWHIVLCKAQFSFQWTTMFVTVFGWLNLNLFHDHSPIRLIIPLNSTQMLIKFAKLHTWFNFYYMGELGQGLSACCFSSKYAMIFWVNTSNVKIYL